MTSRCEMCVATAHEAEEWVDKASRRAGMEEAIGILTRQRDMVRMLTGQSFADIDDLIHTLEEARDGMH